jgi:hypothetical protein
MYIYIYIYMHYYNTFLSLQAYFLPTHGIGTIPILGKLPYICELHQKDDLI